MDNILLSLIVVTSVALLITQWIRLEFTALLLIVALAATGILTPAEALSGFANEATITVGSMFVLSAGLVRTGALDHVVLLAGKFNVRKPRTLLAVIGVLAAVPSAFLNNTAVIIMLIPVVLRLCQKYDIMPSKIMIPLSCFTILGGTVTLVGTSTNILVHSLHRQAGGTGFGMFEFAPMGVCYLLVGGVVILLLAPRILPERKVLSQLLEPQHRSSFVTEVVVPEDSELVGNTLTDLLGRIEKVRILELVRGEEVQLGPDLGQTIRGGDNLLIEGSPQAITGLLQRGRLDLASAVADEQRVKISRIDLLMVEAVVTPNSPLHGLRLSEIGLNRQYGIKVLAVQRMGRHLQIRLREMRIQEGDVLLIQGEQSALYELQNTGGVLIIEGVDRTIRFSAKAPIAVGILVTAVAVAAIGPVPISITALAGAVLMLLTGCLRIPGAIRALDTSVLLVLAGVLPLGLALQKTGMAHDLARVLVSAASHYGPLALIGGVYLMTNVLTAFLSNGATAVLLTPIALQISNEMGIDPKPLLVAVTFAASADFSTPIGYQTNLLVMGPGGYRFRDYLRLGVLLNAVLWLTAMIMIPLIWPIRTLTAAP
jgi:di/tricarboxylate transporter